MCESQLLVLPLLQLLIQGQPDGYTVVRASSANVEQCHREDLTSFGHYDCGIAL
jgi:hypothetical protein